MSLPTESGEASADCRLIDRLETQLGTAMGVRLTLLERLIGTRDGRWLALAWLVLFGAASLLAFLLSTDGSLADQGQARLASLNVWTALHFAGQILLARACTKRALDIVRQDILPFASPEYERAVCLGLKRQAGFTRFQLIPYAVAAIVVLSAFWAIRGELGLADRATSAVPANVLLWGVASFYTYFACMRVVVAATFPGAFADALEANREVLYPLCAAKSPLAQGLANLNRTILTYWVFVFLTFATVMLLVVLPGRFALASGSAFLAILVPVVAFFSLGGGAYVYLRSEAVIAVALRRWSTECAEPLQREIAALVGRLSQRGEDEVARIERFSTLHDQIIAGGCYGSRIGTAVSLLLPFAMPAIGQLERLVPTLLG